MRGCLTIINVDILPASEGDCILITIGTKDKVNILIDGGYKETYLEYLKPCLIKMNKKGEKLDLIIVTHVDADHIEGIIELLKENGNSKSPKIIQIDEIWHNSYKHLQFLKGYNSKLDNREKSILNNKIDKGYIETKNDEDDQYQSQNISAKDGSTLASLIYKGEYNWNTSFDKESVSTDNKKLINLKENVNIRLLGPSNNSLKKLSKYWLKELQKDKYDFKLTDDELFDDAFEFHMLNQREMEHQEENNEISKKNIMKDIKTLSQQKTTLDNSPANGSSITIIIENGDKKLLFLADSHPQTIHKAIQDLVDQTDYKPIFDLIKVSHHGSNKNTSIELLELVDSPVYIFSTNGKKHNHPNDETIARIINRKLPYEYSQRHLLFNYPTISEFFHQKELQQKYKYSITLSDGEFNTKLEL